MAFQPIRKKLLPPSRRGISSTQLIVLSFLAVICIGALLLMLPFATRAGSIAAEDAFFTATSATCITGLVTVDTWQTYTLFGQLVILSLIQVGGLGLITIVAFFNFAIGRRLHLRDIRVAGEAASTDHLPTVRRQIFTIIKTALVFEASGIVLLSFYFVPRFGAEGIYIAIFTAISAFCNAGFDILSRGKMPFTSLTHYSGNPYVLIVISLLIICGGLGFVVWHDLVQYHKTKKLTLHTKLVLFVTAILIVGGTLGVLLMEKDNPGTMGNMPWWQKLLNSYFQAVSARTAGFNSVECNLMYDPTKLFISVLMFIGASSGSTGGGIKVTTMAVLAITVLGVVRNQEDATVFGYRLHKQTVFKALTIFFLAFGVLTAATLGIYYNTAVEFNSVDCIFEASSAFGTVGLTIGATPTMNLVAKIITMLTMYVGRCGPVALAISLTARGMARKSHKVYPTGEILVG